MAGMSKADFAKELKKPGSVKGASTNYSWVRLFDDDLSKREEPFTVSDIVAQIKQPRNYVYQHLKTWVEKGDLLVIKYDGANQYMPATAFETKAPA